MNNTQENQAESSFFEKMLQIIWPIKICELKKFLPMAFIMFCILFNYSALRGIKDALVVSAVGAEAISFIKLYVVIPSAVLFTIMYMKLLNKFGDINVFYVISGIFLSFFALFTFVLYPAETSFHPDPEKITLLAGEFPRFKWLILLYGKWIYASIYVFAELWGSIMLGLLFWQFANKITTTTEAKRFYSMFGLIANFALIASGTAMKSISSSANNQNSFIKLMLIVLVCCGACMMIYYWMNKNVLTDKRYYNPEEAKSPKSKKPKLSIGESVKLLLSSKYLGLILLLVLGYGISINLVEGPWKNKIKELYPTQEGYLNFFGTFNQYMGIGAIFFMFVGSNILRLFSWRTSALITPLVILITGVGFFIFTSFQSQINEISSSVFGVTALALAVFLGAAQNVLSKGVKYSLFDSTKEMAYIPIDNELKTKGKAAVDVIGGRLGKGGGALIQSTLLIIFPMATFESLNTCLMIIFIIIVAAWLFSVNGLSKEYEKSVDTK